MRRLLFLACAVVFIDVTFFAVLTPLLPDFRDRFSLGEGGAGVLAGSFAAGTLVMAMPAGWIAARFGPRRTMIAGLVGIGVFSPLFGFVDHLWLLDGSRFLQGAAGSLMWCGAISWVISSAPLNSRGRMMGMVIAAAVMGELLGAPLGALAHHIGTEIVFGMVLFAAVALIALAMTVPPAAEVDGQPISSAVTALRRSDVPRSSLVLAGPSIAFGLVVVVAPLRMDVLGATPALIAAAFVAGSVIEVVTGPLVGHFSDRAGRTLPYLVGLVTSASAIIGIGVFGLLPVLFAAVMFASFGAGLSFTPASTLVTDAATASGLNQGYASGAANVAWGGGQMIGAVGGGFLAGIAGYLLPTLIVVGILAATAAVARGTDLPLPAEGVREGVG
ncbi:MAG: MFS transporter [Solirubrobacterales bacterium]|nr:MFS transporter [Solirubrobacterales bacterium]